jgi:hypothetical protein
MALSLLEINMNKYKVFGFIALVVASATLSQLSQAADLDIRVNTGPVSVGVEIGNPPPQPRVEMMPAPRAGYVWAPGYWAWDGRHHIWVEGRWVQERPGYAYVPARWEQRGERWRYEPERWEERREERRWEGRRHEEERREEWREEHHRHEDWRDREGR